MKTLTKLERYQGALVGLATGDALGTTLEFTPRDLVKPINDLLGGGPFELNAGQWTDDTSMALCLATSLIECDGFNPTDQMERYVRWYQQGYLSSTGSCFDIGRTVLHALAKFARTQDPFAGSTDANTAGNGSLMRLAPIPLFFAADPEKAIAMAAESSRTTHGAPAAVDACRYYAGLIIGALQGTDKETLLSPLFSPVTGLWDQLPLQEDARKVANGSFREKDRDQILGTGYVIKSMEAALWAFHNASDFKEGALLAVNLGNDADTTGAIYGQLAGTYYGLKGIPAAWRKTIAQRPMIEELAARLMEAPASSR